MLRNACVFSCLLAGVIAAPYGGGSAWSYAEPAAKPVPRPVPVSNYGPPAAQAVDWQTRDPKALAWYREVNPSLYQFAYGGRKTATWSAPIPATKHRGNLVSSGGSYVNSDFDDIWSPEEDTEALGFSGLSGFHQEPSKTVSDAYGPPPAATETPKNSYGPPRVPPTPAPAVEPEVWVYGTGPAEDSGDDGLSSYAGYAQESNDKAQNTGWYEWADSDEEPQPTRAEVAKTPSVGHGPPPPAQKQKAPRYYPKTAPLPLAQPVQEPKPSYGPPAEAVHEDPCDGQGEFKPILGPANLLENYRPPAPAQEPQATFVPVPRPAVAYGPPAASSEHNPPAPAAQPASAYGPPASTYKPPAPAPRPAAAYGPPASTHDGEPAPAPKPAVAYGPPAASYKPEPTPAPQPATAYGPPSSKTEPEPAPAPAPQVLSVSTAQQTGAVYGGAPGGYDPQPGLGPRPIAVAAASTPAPVPLAHTYGLPKREPYVYELSTAPAETPASNGGDSSSSEESDDSPEDSKSSGTGESYNDLRYNQQPTNPAPVQASGQSSGAYGSAGYNDRPPTQVQVTHQQSSVGAHGISGYDQELRPIATPAPALPEQALQQQQTYIPPQPADTYVAPPLSHAQYVIADQHGQQYWIAGQDSSDSGILYAVPVQQLAGGSSTTSSAGSSGYGVALSSQEAGLEQSIIVKTNTEGRSGDRAAVSAANQQTQTSGGSYPLSRGTTGGSSSLRSASGGATFASSGASSAGSFEAVSGTDSKAPYSYAYALTDEDGKSLSDKKEAVVDGVVRGSYSVALPDGRTQIVEYYVDNTGYHPSIRYEGEAKYPETQPASPPATHSNTANPGLSSSAEIQRSGAPSSVLLTVPGPFNYASSLKSPSEVIEPSRSRASDSLGRGR